MEIDGKVFPVDEFDIFELEVNRIQAPPGNVNSVRCMENCHIDK